MIKRAVEKHPNKWRELTHEIVFGADSVRGKVFDIALLLFIIVVC